MKFKINHTPSQNSLVVEAETLEGVRKKAWSETWKRKWDNRDCWSEELEFSKITNWRGEF